MKIVIEKMDKYIYFPEKAREPEEPFLFLDIETTGFSPKSSRLYLIGVLCRETEDTLLLKQWFIENLKDEKKALEDFADFITDFSCLLHFNGTHFDLPYLQQCMASYGLSLKLPAKSLDLYRTVLPFRKYLPGKQLNQRALEKMLGITREDLYTGKELIPLYQDYIRGGCSDERLLSLLLGHNRCDLLGLAGLLPLLAYPAFFSSSFSYLARDLREDVLLLYFHSPVRLPRDIRCKLSHAELEAADHTLCLQLPLFRGELCYYLDNYKDYYYLTKEEICIHKDLACFVDKSVRKKATRENACIRHTDCFIPLYGGSALRQFRKEYAAKQSYIRLADFKGSDMALSALEGALREAGIRR